MGTMDVMVATCTIPFGMLSPMREWILQVATPTRERYALIVRGAQPSECPNCYDIMLLFFVCFFCLFFNNNSAQTPPPPQKQQQQKKVEAPNVESCHLQYKGLHSLVVPGRRGDFNRT